MNPATMKAYEGWAVVGTVDPDALTATAHLSDAIDMSKYDEILAVVLVGDLGTNATVDAKLTQATTSGGTYKDVTGKAITQLTKASPDDSDKQALISCRGEDLDMDSDYRYVKLSVTVGTATSDGGAVVLGRPKSGLASGVDLASVAEMV